MTNATKQTTLVTFLVLGRVLMAVLGGFIAWATIEIAVLFWQSRGSLHEQQWMAVFIGAVQAGLCWLVLQGMQCVTRALRYAIADSAKN